jgi:hypothetical protein
MVWFDRCGRLMLLAIGLTLAASSACADMQVLGSNVVKKYPRDKVIKGNAIKDLGPDEWVRVRMLEDDSTQVFGTPPPFRQGLGTRGARRQAD